MATEVPTLVDRALLLDKCSSFVDFQIWPLTTQISAATWLENFNDGDTKYALHLLSSFMYFAEPLVDQLFSAGFHNLSTSLRPPQAGFPAAMRVWERFCAELIVTFVEGEVPNPTDSGHTFARKARKVLGIDQQRIMSPADALRQLRTRNRPVVFVDDFVGSGNQFIETWHRKYNGDAGYSFAEHAASVGVSQCYYCPAVATQFGSGHIAQCCKGVTVSPGSVLPPEYSALHPQSVVWPDHLRESGPAFVERVSREIGIPDTGGGETDWRGFNKLGLCLALHDSTPDATLPIFFWEENGWQPLVRRG